MRGPRKPADATAGSCSSTTGRSCSPRLPGCTLHNSTTSLSLLLPLLLRLLLLLLVAEGRCHQAFLALPLLCVSELKAARREGRPTD